MAHTPVSSPTDKGKIRREPPGIWHEGPLWMLVVIIATAAVLTIAFVFISVNWPYRHRRIAPMLEDVLASQVTFTSYHRTYFPHPGFVATGITMRRKSALDLPPLGHIDTMIVQGSWLDLCMLRQRIQLVDITGLHVIVPAIGSPANRKEFPPGSSFDFRGPETQILRFVVHEGRFEIIKTDGSPLSFLIAELVIRDLHRSEAMHYMVEMRNAMPRGEIVSTGVFGPLAPKDIGATPVTGDFKSTT